MKVERNATAEKYWVVKTAPGVSIADLSSCWVKMNANPELGVSHLFSWVLMMYLTLRQQGKSRTQLISPKIMSNRNLPILTRSFKGEHSRGDGHLQCRNIILSTLPTLILHYHLSFFSIESSPFTSTYPKQLE
jgi:hypothetical protein